MKYYAIILLVLIIGCTQKVIDPNVVDDLGGSVLIEDKAIGATVEVKDEAPEGFLEELKKVITEKTEKIIETPTKTDHKIMITDFKGKPEDLEIEIGDTVRWDNNQSNFVHVIMIRKDLGEGYYGEHYGEPQRILHGETAQYTFSEAGDYQWYSKTNYPKTSGEIEVE